MAPVVWKPEYSVGVHELDSDHRLLVSLANQAVEAFADADQRVETVGSILNALAEFTEYHFAREEAMMEAVRYPELSQHRNIHRQIRVVLDTYRTSFLADPDSVSRAALIQFLENGITGHMIDSDMLFAPYMAVKADEVRRANDEFTTEQLSGTDVLFVDLA